MSPQVKQGGSSYLWTKEYFLKQPSTKKPINAI